MTTVAVRCDGGPADGWTCTVTVRDGDRAVSTHHVRVTLDTLGRLAPGANEPTDLVTASFAFLLEREPPTSILRSFDLPEISRYFPEYEAEIRRAYHPDRV